MRLFKLTISFLYFVFDVVRRNALKLFGVKSKPICVTLYYHSIYKEEINAFRKQIDLIKKKSIAIPSDYFEKLDPTKLYTILTFDDAFENIYHNAVPILAEKNIPFTIFFVSDYFGRIPEWEFPEGHRDAKERIMTLEQGKNLPDSLLTIGSHTKTHPKLPDLTNDKLISELRDSKLFLERIFNRKVGMLSFPNGEYNQNVLDNSFKAGYDRVFTIDPKLSLKETNERVTGRVWANGNDWYLEFWLKIHGAYCWLDSAFKFKKKFLEKIS